MFSEICIPFWYLVAAYPFGFRSFGSWLGYRATKPAPGPWSADGRKSLSAMVLLLLVLSPTWGECDSFWRGCVAFRSVCSCLSCPLRLMVKHHFECPRSLLLHNFQTAADSSILRIPFWCLATAYPSTLAGSPLGLLSTGNGPSPFLMADHQPLPSLVDHPSISGTQNGETP